MKVSACFSAAVFGSAALAAVNPITMIPRQVDVITGILTKVGNSIDATDSAAKAYDGSNPQPVLDAGKSLVSTINDGVTTATNSQDLTLEGALGLQQPVNDLTSKAQTLVNDLTDKRSTIAKNGQCANTREVVGQINDSSNKLINAIVAKVPQDAQSIAAMLVAKLKAVLAQAQDNFSTANCVDAVVASSAAASSAAAPTSAAAASSAAGAASSAPAASSAAGAASSAGAAPTSKPAGAASSAGVAPTSKPAGGATPTGSAVKPPAGTPTGPATVPTAGAGSLIAPGVFAIGVAVALL